MRRAQSGPQEERRKVQERPQEEEERADWTLAKGLKSGEDLIRRRAQSGP